MRFIIPILDDKDLNCDKRKGICLGPEFKACRQSLEEAINEIPLPIKAAAIKEDHELFQNLTNQLFDVLYLSFTLLDRLEDVNKEIIKNGERNLIKNIYCDNWKLKKIIEVEI